MANEAVLKDRISNAIDFTWWNDAVGAEKGTILKLSGARIVAATSADNDPVIGILAREKIANDGRTQVPVYINGIFDCYVDTNTAFAVGSQVAISGANIVKGITTLDDEKGYVFGRFLETPAVGFVQVLVGSY